MKNNTLLSKMSNTATSLRLHCFQGYTAFSCNTQLVHAYFSGSHKITIYIPATSEPSGHSTPDKCGVQGYGEGATA